MKTKKSHLTLIIITLSVGIIPLFFLVFDFLPNARRYTKCRTQEDFVAFATDLKNGHSPLAYRYFYKRAKAKRLAMAITQFTDSVKLAQMLSEVIVQKQDTVTNDEADEDDVLQLLHNTNYLTYHNKLYNYTFSYPSFMRLGGEDPKGNGCYFDLGSGFQMIVIFDPKEKDKTFEYYYKKYYVKGVVKHEYHNDWFAFSNQLNSIQNSYFYMANNNNTLMCVILKYPIEYEEAMQPIIKRVVTSFPPSSAKKNSSKRLN